MLRKTVTFLLLVLCFSSCFAGEDTDAVKQTFANYRQALLSQNGMQAAELVTEETIAQYKKYVDWATTATKDELMKLNLMNRLQVILIKHRVPRDMLLNANGKDIFAYAVDNGWIGKASVMNTSLGEVQVASDSAVAEVLVQEKRVPTKFNFLRQAGTWRFNLLQTMAGANMALKAMIMKQGVTENDFIITSAENLSGTEVPEDIWQPIVK